MNGLVLTGGKSSRMGMPKAEIAYHGVPEFLRCAHLLASVCEKVFLSTSEYWTPAEFPPTVSLLPDPVGASRGPLTGIAQAFKQSPETALFVLACDMPMFDEEALAELQTERDTAQNATCFALDGRTPEPLCAIYEPSAAPMIIDALAHDIRCARKVLDSMQAKRVVPKNADWVRNINESREINVDVLFVAQLREAAGKASERIVTKRVSAQGLYEDLRSRYGFRLKAEHMRVAVNDEIVAWSKSLNENDRVMFVPPVAGG